MSENVIKLSWRDILTDTVKLADKLKQNSKPVDVIINVGRGGNIPGTLLGYYLNVKNVISYTIQSYSDINQQGSIKVLQSLDEATINQLNGKRVLIVDDLSDKGTTLRYLRDNINLFNGSLEFCTLYIKENTTFMPDNFIKQFSSDCWLVFPWDELTESLLPFEA